MVDEVAPLLVLASGQRCGSTLIQRLLSSHPLVRIWGEHVGQLLPVLTATARLRLWTDMNGLTGRRELARSGHHGFLANLTPERDTIDDACRAFIETLFATPSAEAGRPIWGFKEIRYGLPEVLLLRQLFPRMRVIHVIRDPRDVLRSLDEWEQRPGWTRRNTEEALDYWLTVARSFIGSDQDPHLGDFILRAPYEALVVNPGPWTAAIAEHCRLDADLLDQTVFDTRVHAAGDGGRGERQLREWSALPSSLRALIDGDDYRSVASAYGYDL